MSFSASVEELVFASSSPLHSSAPWWKRIPLGEVASILNGFPWKSEYFNERSGPHLIRIRDVTSGTTETRYSGPVAEGYWVEPGDLLVGMDGDFNAIVWGKERGLLNQRVCKIDTDAQCFDKAFLARVLPPYLKLINDHTHSVTVKHLSSNTLAEIPVPLPPLPEQRRILAKLDTLSARSKRARAELDRIPALIRRTKEAVLCSVFDDPSDEHGTVSDIVTSIDAGKNVRCVERPPQADDIGVVKVSAVTWGKFDPQASKTLPADFRPPPHTRIKAGDFLFSRANTIELVGACVIVDDAPANLYLSDKILRFNLSDENKRWLLWFLRSPSGRSALEAASSGNQHSMRNISQSGLLKIQMPLPPPEIRSAIVNRIEAIFTKLDRLAAEARSAAALLDRLDQAILAKAFRGELVPQDPNDEPALALLERIRAGRATKGNPAARRRRLP